MKFKLILYMILFSFGAVLLASCEILRDTSSNELLLGDVVYGSNKSDDFTIYILENEVYVPYLVLTNNYEGNALLLRKYVLEEDYMFNDETGYYAKSLLDQILSDEFMKLLDPSIREKLIETNIQIMSETGIGVAGNETEIISRNIFLLSYEEFGLDDTGFTPTGGTELMYFKDTKSRIATDGNIPRSWWLRTTYTVHPSTAWAIFIEGQMGPVGVNEKSGVRPAFCLSNDLEVEKSESVVEGETVLVIKK